MAGAALDSSHLLIFSSEGRRFSAPRGSFLFVFPRPAVDTNGTLHLVWAEPTGAVDLSTIHDVRQLELTKLWHASMRNGVWTRPAVIYEGRRINWDPVASSALLVDSKNRLHIAFADDPSNGRGLVVHLVNAAGQWSENEFPLATPAAYADVAAGPHGDIAVAFVASDSRSRPAFHPNVLFSIYSETGMSNWQGARVITTEIEEPAYEPRIVFGKNKAMHVIWRRHSPGSSERSTLWYATSNDRGDTWNGKTSIPVAGFLNQMQVAVNQAGAIQIIVTAYGQRRAILCTVVMNGRWRLVRPIAQDEIAAQPSLVADANGRLHLARIRRPTKQQPNSSVHFELVYSTTLPRQP
ncbi:MAG: sialidase family protein [Gemmatimonadota bacterium]